ncbi:MAG: hypothetical protein N3A54_03465 [Patescibacteria group bacterium]|nr:hypothetical protein [Patescibacteria group bacterium]
MDKNMYNFSDSKELEKQIREYVKRYYGNTTNDMSDFGFNSMLFGILSHIGEKIMFYQDYYINEKFLSTANDLDSILKHAKREGMKFTFGGVASGRVVFYIEVPEKDGYVDEQYIPVLKGGTVLSSENGIYFTLVEDVKFDQTNLKVGQVNPSTGSPTTFILKGVGSVISGRILEEKKEVQEFQPFRKVYFGNFDVAEVVSVVDSSGNEYYEVDNLSQNIVYKRDKNDSIYPIAVPYRFVFDRDARGHFLQFGSGSDQVDFRSILDDVQKHVAVFGKEYTGVYSFDPYCLAHNDKFGIAPSNTEITIRYRSIEQSNINVGAGGLTNIVERNLEFQNSSLLEPETISAVSLSLECYNHEAIVGKMYFDNTEELKQRIVEYTRSQRRAVSKEDYIALVFSMPRKFGAIKRCSVDTSFIGDRNFINVYVASVDQNGKLCVSSDTLKKNLYEWLSQYKIVSDNINIFDLNIVNLGIEYTVVVERGYDKNEILRRANSVLRDFYKISLAGGESLDLTNIYKLLIGVSGVVDVSYLNVVQKFGENYSSYPYDLFRHLSSDGKIIYAEPNIVFEFKYAVDDIKGSVI